MSENSKHFRLSAERLHEEMADSLDEELEMEIDDDRLASLLKDHIDKLRPETIDRHFYFNELLRLQCELVKLQEWVLHQKLKVVVLFEGRDAAGKGGVIKRITQRLNPRLCKAVALSAPNGSERTQWYFQRYVSHGTSSAMFPTCLRPAKSCCSTAAGTTALGSSGSWGSAPKPTAKNFSAPCPSLSECWCDPV
jgi:Polyphosphate kinase 2 (PPK2)